MNESGGMGWKLGLAGACLAAALFAALWFLRGGEVDGLESRLRAERAEAGDAARRLEGTLTAAKTDAEAARRELAEASERNAREIRQIRELADQSESRLRAELADAAGRMENSAREAERQRKELSTLKAAAGELNNLKENLAKAEADNAGLRESADRERKASGALAGELRNKLLQAERRLAELEKLDRGEAPTGKPSEASAASVALDAAASAAADAAAARAEAGEWRERAAELEKRLAESGERSRAETLRLSRELEEARREREPVGSGSDTDARLAALERELTAARERELPAVRNELSEVKSRLTEALASLSAAREQLSAAQAVRDALSAAKAELAAAKNELSGARDELSSVRAAAASSLRDATDAGERALARVRAEAKVEAKAETDRLRRTHAGELAELEKRYAARNFGNGPAGRAVGRIVERLADGRTLVITGGIDQRMNQGMKFDVYRQSGDRRRYLGGIKVIRVLKDYSLAISTFSETRTAVCPATGLAVFEPGARFSPFVTGGDGAPLPLRPSSAQALPLEAPAIGDLLDNPFYDPERSLTFAISSKLLDDPCFTRTIEFFGGSPRTGPEAARADFLVVEDGAEDPGAVASGVPRRVTLGHLEKYMEPILLPE